MEYTPVKTQIDYSKLENSEIDFYGVKKRRIFHYTSIRGLDSIAKVCKILKLKA